MSQKELKRMSRQELVEIIYRYQQQSEAWEREKELLESQLNDRLIRIEASGSIAEAALALNGVFEAAQVAADQYVESVEASRTEASRILEEATRRANDIVMRGQMEGEALRKRGEEEYVEAIAMAEVESQAIRDQAMKTLKSHEELLALLHNVPSMEELSDG